MAKLTFLGTGTSQGVPVIGCGCRVCSSNDSRDKRLRSSVMIEQGNTRIVIDAGPDFRQQMLRHDVKRLDGILLTHEHKDHVGGIDDVRAFNYTMRRPMDIYATARTQQTVVKDFDYAFEEDRYPGVPDINLVTIDGENPFRVGDVHIIPIEGLHYKLPVLGFRIDNLAYLTDFNHISDDQAGKLSGVDILVVNALRQEKHLSHFSLSEAIELAAKVGAKRTYLTHISHQMGMHGEMEKQLPPDTFFAYDGFTVETA